MLVPRRGFFMKILRNVIILTFIVNGLLFARIGEDSKRVELKNLKVKSNHYWVNNYSNNDNDLLDRKRSHKRRRKIRKPVKGLR